MTGKVRSLDLRYQANSFRIWREGHAVGWDCTIADLVAATGLSETTVARICQRRGWPVQPTEGARRMQGPEPVTTRFKRPSGGHDRPRSNAKDPVRALQRLIEETKNYGADETISLAD